MDRMIDEQLTPMVRKQRLSIRLLGVIGLSATLQSLLVGQVAVNSTILLTPRIVRDNALRLDGSFDVSPDGAVVLRTGDNLFDLNARVRLLKADFPGLESFAFTPDGALLTISHQKLGFLQAGSVLERVALPASGMALAAGPRRASGPGEVYLFGGTSESNKAIYMYEAGGAYRKLLEGGGPISALAAVGNDLFFAIDNAVYLARLGEHLRLAVLLPEAAPISSLAADSSGVLYVAAGQAVYALAGARVVLLSPTAGSSIKYHAGSLYVLNAAQGVLVRLDSLSATVVQRAAK
jgi:hypothetical protein